ncbi:MAG: hypothetical protein JSR60_11500 [Proteobacteria bacterium]|nr:hypothetical protein [Pseudomonadota bacterium]
MNHSLKRILRWAGRAAVVIGVSLLLSRVGEAVSTAKGLEELASVQEQTIRVVESSRPSDFFALFVDAAIHKAPSPAAAARPVRLGYWAMNGQERNWLRPLYALADTVWHLFGAGDPVARLILIGEFAAGFLLTLWAMLALYAYSPVTFVYPTLYGIVIPFLTVIAGTLVGEVVYLAMLAGMSLLGWVTSLAGLCCGAGTLATAIWSLVVEGGRISAEDRIRETLLGRVFGRWLGTAEG